MTDLKTTDRSEKDSLFIVTGLSGAGLSSALKILEDAGFDVFDNFPLALLDPLLKQQRPHHRPIALGMDTRTREFDPDQIQEAVNALRKGDEWDVRTFFLTADDNVLLKRFTETRRTHPLARDRSVIDGITTEKSLLYPLKHKANAIIDTSELSIHDLRRVFEGHVEGIRSKRMNISLMSFSYKHGIPREADLVFDMRFLRNPNWVADLKDKTGRDREVQDYVAGDPRFGEFETTLKSLLNLIVPAYAKEGKNYLTIAFGCTGGKHRSVTLAEKVSGWLKNSGHPVTIHHRELKG